MAGRPTSGATAFDGYRYRLEARARRCSDCGHVDAESSWRVGTTGDRVTYRRVCPSCDAVDTRNFRLS
jgi:hypothetical protein